MKEVYSNSEITRVGFYKSVLDEAGIPNVVRNETLHNLIIAQGAVVPSLCVTDPTDYARAIALLAPFEEPAPAEGSEWICTHCQEKVPAVFGSCWNCETVRP
ncbi:MAG: DUF2007 domain-containing protein [Akkermansiaceae bacterium]